MRTEVRQRADMENSLFVSDTEIDRYLDESLTDLYDLLVADMGMEAFQTSTTFVTVANQREYTLPSTYYLLLGVEVEVTSGDTPIPLKPYMYTERYDDSPLYPPRVGGWAECARYRTYNEVNQTTGVVTHYIRFNVKPPDGHTVRVWFVPSCPVLDADTDVFDGVNGWEEYAIIDSALKCLEKEQNPSLEPLQLRLARVLNRIRSLAHSRDASFPQRVQDVSAG
jgi:hypothetical protein